MSSQDEKKNTELQQLYGNGIAMYEQGRYSQAVELYKKITEHIPDADLVNYNLGLALYELGKYPEAMEAFSLAIHRNRDDPDYWFNFGLAARQAGRYDIAHDAYLEALALQPDHPDIFYNIGCCHRVAGEIERAAAAFEKTLVLDQDYAPALNNLAYCLHFCGKYEHADKVYHRLLELRPDHAEASYMLAALKGENIKSPPPGYVAGLFDSYSADFDHDLLERLNYRVPGLLREMLVEVIRLKGKEKITVDLGCGTGLSGLAVSDLASNLTGVDLSAKMIEKAEEKGCYDALFVGDAVEFMLGLRRPVDMLVAADVLTYSGELEPLFRAAAGCLAGEGILCFSTELSKESGYKLLNSGRYGHSRDYINSLAHRLGFKLLKRKEENIRREREQWIIGDIYLCMLSVR